MPNVRFIRSGVLILCASAIVSCDRSAGDALVPEVTADSVWSIDWFRSGLAGLSVEALYVPDPNVWTQFYAGTSTGLLYSSDSGKQWTQIFAPPGTITAVAGVHVPQVQLTRMLVGTTEGLSVSLDNGATWQTVLTGRSVASIEFSERLPAALLALVGTKDSVLLTGDFGSTWVNVSGTLAGRSVRDFVIDLRGEAYAATDSGVYSFGTAWTSWTHAGLAGRSVRSMAFNREELYAATDRGLYVRRWVGAQWQLASALLTDSSVVAVAASDLYTGENSIYAGTASGRLYHWYASTDRAPGVQQIAGGIRALASNKTVFPRERFIAAGTGAGIQFGRDSLVVVTR